MAKSPAKSSCNVVASRSHPVCLWDRMRMVLISSPPTPTPFPVPTPGMCSIPLRLGTQNPSTDQQSVLLWHLHAWEEILLFYNACKSKLSPKKEVTSHCQKSPRPPAGYLHLFYNSNSQRVFQELIGVPESLSGGLQNYFYNNTRVCVALIHNNTKMLLVVILIHECRVDI